ncbi:hypothetical protein HFO25_12915 [Rhizobium laguerreae]|nr:hypothetical protein [Rhizobium laguerreae]
MHRSERQFEQSLLATLGTLTGANEFDMALCFASQGQSVCFFPYSPNQMIFAAFFGWSAVIWFRASVNALFQIVALAELAYGVLTISADFNPRRRTGFELRY